MSGKQRRIRRATVSFDEDEEEPGSMAAPPASVKAAQAQRDKGRKKGDGRPLLSFDEDLGGEGGAGGKKKASGDGSSKPRASLRAPSAAKPAESAAAAPSTQVSAAGEYTADRIRELQKNALRAPSTAPAAARPPAAAGFKLSGSFKPAGAPKDSRFQYNVQAAAVVQPEEQEGADLPPPPPGAPPAAAAAQQQQQRAGSAGAGEMPPPPPPPAPPGAGAAAGQAAGEEDEDNLDIPDEKMIQWAKAKRERLRAAHLAPDYIPTASLPAGLSRLRDRKKEEAEAAAGSGSDEEEDHVRLQFMAGGSRREQPSTLGESPQRAGAKPEEEDEEDWAREQIRKGMGGLMRGEAAVGPSRRSGAVAAAGAAGATALEAGGPDLGGAAGRAPPGSGFGLGGGSQAARIQAQAEDVVRALQQGLQRLQASHKQADRNLQRTAGNLEGSVASIGRMEGELSTASDKYVFLQKLRAYVQDLCYMLQDKSPLVEELEDQLLQLYEGRADAFRERRRLEDEESQAPAEAAVNAALAVLSRGGAAPAAAAAAEAAAAAAEQQQLGARLPVELDEFGRDVNAERRRDAAKRAQQRQARLAAVEQQRRQQAGGGAELRLGEATSEESEAEGAHFQLRQGEIQEAAGAVFRDAADEFGSLAAVKRELEGWKARYPGPYRDAYMSVSAPALFAPFVRLELLRWRPLDGGSAGFDMHDWYQQLFDYGMGPDPAAADPDDPDANLVPQLVQKLVLPLARHLLEAVWDPLSRRQSRAAAAMVADLLVYVPAEDEGLQGLLRMVQSRLEQAIEGITLPAWPPAALAASARAEAMLAHRFGRALRLLQSVCGFEGALARGVLQNLALERLVAGRLLPFIRIAAADVAKAADRIQRTVAALPAEWFRGGPLRGTEGLLELCNTLARSLEAQAADAGARAAHAAAAKQLSSAMLILGGDTARANHLAKAYGVL